MKRSICASGRGYVPSDSIGFCVAMTRNGSGTGYDVCAIVTWRSCITSSSADCTFAGARLISSARRKLQNTGPSSVSKAPSPTLYTRVPTRSEGTRSGVNWIREKDPPRTPAVVLIVRVFARPGTPSISRWPCASRHTSTRSSMASCPAITRLISKSACSSRSLASVGEGTGRSFCGSVTWAPSVLCTESYTTADHFKFLLRARRARCFPGGQGRRGRPADPESHRAGHRALHRADRRPQPPALRQGAGAGIALRRSHRPGRDHFGPAERCRRRGPTRTGQRLPARDWSFKAPVRPGDEITAEVEVLEAREDKPITRLRTTITNAGGTVVLDGTALVWTEPL